MEPRLNINVNELFKTALAQGEPEDPNFESWAEPWDEDFIDVNSNHFQNNFRAYDEQRQGLGDQIQRYVDMSHMHADDVNTGSDPVPMSQNKALISSPDLSSVPAVTASAKLASQVNGFNNAQANPDVTLGVVASANAGTLVNARVVAETPSTKIAGTIIAVGDREFAVAWDDKTASVERKGDYELVITE